MSRRPDDALKRELLDTLADHGGAAGNTKMIKLLGWSEDQYWRIREKLIEDGLVTRGFGRGGSVVLAPTTVVAPAPVAPLPVAAVVVAASPEPVRPREVDLYAPCVETIRSAWCRERSLHDVRVELTAMQGSRRTGGDWTRPDIVVLSMRTFKHWPGKYYDLWTFEIKPAGELSVIGVFEAAAHSRAATHSFSLFHVPEPLPENDDMLQRCVAEAQRFQVGLVVFADPADFSTWDFLVDPIRHQPDPELLEQFVATQLSNDAKDTLIRWQK
ncbi:MAG: hypothetical protein IPH07_15645 [Deltaproteobacteria bacterium]|nr:hypothetical protein [Deltaproteobacteria bacterium]MBK8719716.1 hypothetical protein [Deltaproteobacteria bacterium]MBP7288670.1 hypothetical protein [Nannocystaceae bacterium]